MSLFTKTAHYLLLVSLLISIVGSLGFYELIHLKIQYDVDESLLHEVKKTEQRLQRFPIHKIVDWDDNPHIEPISLPMPAEFCDIQLPDSLNQNQLIDIRQYQTTVLAHNQLYLVRFRQPYFEFDELARHLSMGIILVFLLLMAVSVGVGLGLSQKLWQPFYFTIDQLSKFQLDGPRQPVFTPSHIREFSLLNRSLGELVTKLQRQFSLQKQFTENASHELQTPLAVASAELDCLFQSIHLTEKDHAHLQRANEALKKLSQINRSLLLLTQLENNQFVRNESINFSNLVDQSVAEFEPFFMHKRLTLQSAVTPNVKLKINRSLAGVLLTNLLKNTLRHSSVGGHVTIQLTENTLTIGNTGKPLPFDDSLLFNRFVKDPAGINSIGLGLAIVKQICDQFGLALSYLYNSENREHRFTIGLSQL